MKTQIIKEEYLSWLDHPCTKRFMEDMREDLQSYFEERISGSVESMVKQAHERNASIDLIQAILDWKPSEIIEDN